MSQWATNQAKAAGETVHRIYVGYFCPRGGTVEDGGHFMLLNDPNFDHGCSGKGWDLTIEVEDGDVEMLPDWMKRQVWAASATEIATDPDQATNR